MSLEELLTGLVIIFNASRQFRRGKWMQSMHKLKVHHSYVLCIPKKSPHFLLSSKVSRLFAIRRLDFASKVTAAMVGRIVVQFGPKNV